MSTAPLMLATELVWSAHLAIETRWLYHEGTPRHTVYRLPVDAGQRCVVSSHHYGTGDRVTVRGLYEAHDAAVADVRAGRLPWWERRLPEPQEEQP